MPYFPPTQTLPEHRLPPKDPGPAAGQHRLPTQEKLIAGIEDLTRQRATLALQIQSYQQLLKDYAEEYNNLIKECVQLKANFQAIQPMLKELSQTLIDHPLDMSSDVNYKIQSTLTYMFAFFHHIENNLYVEDYRLSHKADI